MSITRSRRSNHPEIYVTASPRAQRPQCARYRTIQPSALCRLSGPEDTAISRHSRSRLVLSKIAGSTAMWAESTSFGRRTPASASSAGDWRTGDVRIETGACVGRDSITQAGGGVARMSSWVIPRMKQLEKHLLRNGDAGTCQWKVSGSKATDGYQALGSTESGNQTNVPSISTWRSQETTRREAR